MPKSAMERAGEVPTWRVDALHLDTVHYPEGHPRAGEFGPVYAFLLTSGTSRVLVDTGIGPPHPVIDRLYEPERTDLASKLAKAHGIVPGDIDAVVLTHLHFDHLGGAQWFAGTPLYVQQAEWEAAQGARYTIPEWLTFPGATFVMVAGDTELFPGFRVEVTADHTPGHQVVMVTTDDGVVVLAGQSVETCAELEAMASSGSFTDGARRMLALQPVRVYFSHDHRVWEA